MRGRTSKIFNGAYYVMYDEQDNNIGDYDNIEQVCKTLQIKKITLQNYISLERKLSNGLKLFKMTMNGYLQRLLQFAR